jgi:NADPH:quinone reductase-like Zn-dependent oxidoreductase
MNAALYDKRDKFTVEKIQIPNFSANELLVQVKAGAINPVDYKIRTCDIPFLRWIMEHTVGRDFSGIVVDIGTNVKKFKIGDEVYGNAAGGSLQEYTRVNENQIALKPSNINHCEAASIALAGATSLQALLHWGNLNNKKVLIIGGSGGCGNLGIQIAKYYNSKVYAVCSNKNINYVKSLGADIIIDYTKKDFLDDLKNEKFDLIYDTVTSMEDENQEIIYRKFLKSDGKYVAINPA